MSHCRVLFFNFVTLFFMPKCLQFVNLQIDEVSTNNNVDELENYLYSINRVTLYIKN